MEEVFQISNVETAPLFHEKKMEEGVNILQLFIGSSALVIGALFYYFFRSAEHIYFLKLLGINPHLKYFLPPVFVTLGNWLPTFLHPFSFILLSVGILACRKKWQIFSISCFWLGLNVLFELGQKFKLASTAIVPEWFAGIPYLENARVYFLNGTFDNLDLISMLLAVVSAYFTSLLTIKERREI